MVFDEELIEEVKKHPFIYNLKDPDYKKINKKDAAWLEISKALGKEAETCRKKWKNLRDAYRKIKRTCILPSGSGVDPSKEAPKKWKYYDILSFLDDYEYYRKGLQSSFEDVGADVEIRSESDMSLSFDETSFIDSEDIIDIVSPSPSCSTKKRKNQDLSEFLKGATDAIEKLCGQNAPLVTQNSPLVTHFISLAQRIESSNIPERTKLLIEQEVSHLVLQRLYEENCN